MISLTDGIRKVLRIHIPNIMRIEKGEWSYIYTPVWGLNLTEINNLLHEIHEKINEVTTEE